MMLRPWLFLPLMLVARGYALEPKPPADLGIELVAIPAGSFVMGSPDTENGGRPTRSPARVRKPKSP